MWKWNLFFDHLPVWYIQIWSKKSLHTSKDFCAKLSRKRKHIKIKILYEKSLLQQRVLTICKIFFFHTYLFQDLSSTLTDFEMKGRLRGVFPNVRSSRHLLRIWSIWLVLSTVTRCSQWSSVLQALQNPINTIKKTQS